MSFLWEAVVFCASRNTVATCVRSALSGDSVGMSTLAVEEARETVDARGLKLPEDLVEAAVEVRVDLVEDLGGILETVSICGYFVVVLLRSAACGCRDVVVGI